MLDRFEEVAFEIRQRFLTKDRSEQAVRVRYSSRWGSSITRTACADTTSAER